jgi:hypothetical protein
MQQIADWLEKLGLGQYAQPFGENDINLAILPHLRDQDLKELGVKVKNPAAPAVKREAEEEWS